MHIGPSCSLNLGTAAVPLVLFPQSCSFIYEQECSCVAFPLVSTSITVGQEIVPDEDGVHTIPDRNCSATPVLLCTHSDPRKDVTKPGRGVNRKCNAY